MDNFIRVYENAFSDELCDRLIRKFEFTPDSNKERHDMGEMHFLKSTLELVVGNKNKMNS